MPDSFEEHVHILMDLIAVAFASDTTRVFSFKLGRDASGRSYPESGVTTGFHNASHHGEREDRIMEFAKINRYHVSMLPYLLGKLKNTPEGDGNLLDNSLLDLRLADGRLEHPQPQARAARPGGPRRRQADRRRPHQGAGRHADGERDVHRPARARPRPISRASATAPARST